MTWSINVVGTKAGARKAVQEAKAYGSDSSQIDHAKAAILAEIDALPDGSGVRVDASGHHNDWSRHSRIEVNRVQLALDP